VEVITAFDKMVGSFCLKFHPLPYACKLRYWSMLPTKVNGEGTILFMRRHQNRSQYYSSAVALGGGGGRMNRHMSRTHAHGNWNYASCLYSSTGRRKLKRISQETLL
jgi:hypothetical protein